MALILAAARYWVVYSGDPSGNDPNLPRLPPYTLSLVISGAIVLVSAVVAEYAAKNRTGVLLAYLAAALGVGLSLYAIIAPLTYDPTALPAYLKIDRVAATLPAVMTLASTFLGLLPKEIRGETLETTSPESQTADPSKSRSSPTKSSPPEQKS
jgi:cytochrome c biogenesis protein CcdA